MIAGDEYSAWQTLRVAAGQPYLGWADGLGHVLDLILDAEFGLEPSDKLLTLPDEHLGELGRPACFRVRDCCRLFAPNCLRTRSTVV